MLEHKHLFEEKQKINDAMKELGNWLDCIDFVQTQQGRRSVFIQLMTLKFIKTLK